MNYESTNVAAKDPRNPSPNHPITPSPATHHPPLRLAIVGCGGMGRRHLAGIMELARGGFQAIDLVAVCDPNERNAADLADEAKEMLGQRPAVFASAPKMVAEFEGLEAATCTTDSGSHHRVAAELLELGLHTLCEKP